MTAEDEKLIERARLWVPVLQRSLDLPIPAELIADLADRLEALSPRPPVEPGFVVVPVEPTLLSLFEDLAQVGRPRCLAYEEAVKVRDILRALSAAPGQEGGQS